MAACLLHRIPCMCVRVCAGRNRWQGTMKGRSGHAWPVFAGHVPLRNYAVPQWVCQLCVT